jgi:hypothetical protein
MSKNISFLLFLFAGLSVQAQDTLYTVGGQKIPAKVIEINQTEIKYKKATNLDGPTYVVDKTDVALIEYKNGSKELFGSGSGSSNSNDQQVAVNDNPQPNPRVNVIIGGGWGWGGWPLFNSWNWWGGYRVYPRVRHHRYYYYKPQRHHRNIHYGRRGR